ncbi:MAG: sugar transferase [Deltaproteobacteria bacterium]|nr:sugar transferase [Deltaproteobacteria bacterium]
MTRGCLDPIAEAYPLLPTPWSKRAFDVALSGMGLIVSLPVWALAAAAIKFEDGGSIFFYDQRVGQGGRTFAVFKFRTMMPNADQRFGPRQATLEDPRVTRIGKWLRATAMDELPQLWNIFRGDMSFVGPRALRVGEILTRGDGQVVVLADVVGYQRRHQVVPGLTGIAQIYADRDIPPRRKFRYDTRYIARRGFGLDLRLIFLSFWITFRGGWERRGKKW